MFIDTKEGSGRDLSQPTLENLAYLLRHKEFWPVGFHWDFSYVGTCAIGLSINFWWPRDYFMSPRGGWISVMGRWFGLSPREAMAIFVQGHGWWQSPFVSPERVAKRIDRYLAGRNPGRYSWLQSHAWAQVLVSVVAPLLAGWGLGEVVGRWLIG